MCIIDTKLTLQYVSTLRNVGNYTPNDTVLCPRGLVLSVTAVRISNIAGIIKPEKSSQLPTINIRNSTLWTYAFLIISGVWRANDKRNIVTTSLKSQFK